MFSGNDDEKDVQNFVLTEVMKQLDRFDSNPAPGNIKLGMYRLSFPSFNAWNLSVHQLNPIWVRDTLTPKVIAKLKKWAGLPANGASNDFLFRKNPGVGLPNPYDLFRKSTLSKWLQIKESADPLMHKIYESSATNEKKARKKNWSPFDMIEILYDRLETEHENWAALSEERRKFLCIKEANKIFEEECKKRMKESAPVQSQMISKIVENTALLPADIQDFIEHLDHGSASFAMNAFLGTNMNRSRRVLFKWADSGTCPLCNKSPQTINHILSNCDFALGNMDHQFNRMLWRHNGVLETLVKHIRPFIPTDMDMFVDLPESRPSYADIPKNIIARNEFRPDLVLVDNRASGNARKAITIVELTCPLAHNQPKRHEEKVAKYSTLLENLPLCYLGNTIAFEVTSNTGQVSKSIDELLRQLKMPRDTQNKCKRALTMEVIQRSARMYRARDVKFWNPNNHEI